MPIIHDYIIKRRKRIQIPGLTRRWLNKDTKSAELDPEPNQSGSTGKKRKYLRVLVVVELNIIKQ